jgi:ankyrin repeat protein
MLLERGANLEAADEEGAIPLHDACAGGSLNCNILIVELFKFIG